MKLSNIGLRHCRRRTKSVLASARAICLPGTRQLIVAGLLAWSVVAGAQSISLPMPGSSSANPLPKAWPAEEEKAMLQKLIALAEGPPPSIEELSKSMGVTIEKAWNFTETNLNYKIRGPAPFRQPDSGSYLPVSNMPYSQRLYVDFLFDDVTKQPSLGGRPFCLTGDLIAEQLKKLGWTPYRTIVQPHSVTLSGLKKETSDYEKHAGWTLGGSHCMKSFGFGNRLIQMPDK